LRIDYVLGWLAVFASASFFYMATVTIRVAQAQVDIAPAFFTFCRFALGFLVVSASMAIQRRSIRANRYRFIVARTISNTVAVFCFYQAVNVTTVAHANILNMTYPIFVAIITWFYLHEQRDGIALLMVPVAFAGIWMIISPSISAWDWHNGWGLASGITASFAMVFLNVCRKYDSAETTLFYMFGWGALLLWLFFSELIFWPNLTEFYYLLICSVFGVGGQYLLTYGFRYVTAVEGSILSSTRILLAAVLGPFVVADPALPLSGWMGALLIFSANVVLAVRKGRAVLKRQKQRHPTRRP
jgi:drug/metabolite transporter (DMT)-like permease